MSAGKVNRVYIGSECSVMVILNRLSRERLTEYIDMKEMRKQAIWSSHRITFKAEGGARRKAPGWENI